MVIGVPKEIMVDERRVALVPERVGHLVSKGQEVLVESGAGHAAYFDDSAYAQAGAQMVPDPRGSTSRAEPGTQGACARLPIRDSEVDEIDLMSPGSGARGKLLRSARRRRSACIGSPSDIVLRASVWMSSPESPAPRVWMCSRRWPRWPAIVRRCWEQRI